MDPQAERDNEGLYWNSTPPTRNLGLNFFSQPPSFPTAGSHFDGRGAFPHRGADGVEGLDLNSEAADITNNMSYLDLLRSSPADWPVEGDRSGDARAALRGGGRGAGRNAGRAAGRGGVRAAGRGAGGGRGTGRAVPALTREATDHDVSVPSPTAGRAGRGRGRGRAASSRHPSTSVPQQFCPPRPAGGGLNTAGASDATFDTGLQDQELASYPWSQNPYDEEADDDIQELDASMNLSSSGEDDKSVETSSSSDDDAITRKTLSQLDFVQQFGAVACMFGMYYESTFMNKTKKLKTGLSGDEWVMKTLNDPTDCYDMFRMSRNLFFKLHDVLVSSYGLNSSKKMSSVESLALFLWVVGAPQSLRQGANRFERSIETISRKFEQVLDSVYRLSADVVKPIDPQFRNVHPRLRNPRFSPHFDNCIGAMDGTHIPVIVPSSKLLQYVGRHGYSSQNVLAICDFDMRFTFAVAGWPGSAHDMRVFNDAINKYGDKFPHPPQGKFYLVDSGYPNRPGYLAPYKGTKYHLPEFRQGPRPRGKKEVFNYFHSSLRNVIERAFGVLKMKWRILLDLPGYPMRKQNKIIHSCMALHNFIRESKLRDQDFDMCDQDEEYIPMLMASSSRQSGANIHLGDEDVDMNAFRDSIANALLPNDE
ncbi:unnamed protein product [Urochloa humidicola]